MREKIDTIHPGEMGTRFKLSADILDIATKERHRMLHLTPGKIILNV